jgi:hypothetical protein
MVVWDAIIVARWRSNALGVLWPEMNGVAEQAR